MIIARKIITCMLFIAIAATLHSQSLPLPKGWFKSGSKPSSYDMGIAAGEGRDSNNVATIKSHRVARIHGYGSLKQYSSPGKYAGQRVRMTGWVKTNDANDGAALWFRVDAENSKAPLTIDNMSDRPITGTTNWTKYEIVLDVAPNASKIAYGALLRGNGQIWFDDLKFEIVDTSVPVTSHVQDTSEPSNLNFEK